MTTCEVCEQPENIGFLVRRRAGKNEDGEPILKWKCRRCSLPRDEVRFWDAIKELEAQVLAAPEDYAALQQLRCIRNGYEIYRQRKRTRLGRVEQMA